MDMSLSCDSRAHERARSLHLALQIMSTRLLVTICSESQRAAGSWRSGCWNSVIETADDTQPTHHWSITVAVQQTVVCKHNTS